MTDPGCDDARHPSPAAHGGRRTATRAALALAALLVLLAGVAATAPSAEARPRAADRGETPGVVASGPRIERGRPPRGRERSGGAARGETPVAIEIPAIGVDAPVEVRTTVGTTMQDPTGPDVVAWYDDTDGLGPSGNAVFAGHLDYPGVGPAVFADLAELDKNDRILVTDDNGDTVAYRVVLLRTVDAATGPWDDLTASTRRPMLTLITCADPWDAAAGHYTNRLVVRAVRVGG